MAKFKLDRASRIRCAEIIRKNSGRSLKQLLNDPASGLPFHYRAIKKAYGSTQPFLKELGIKICELRHFGSQYTVDVSRKVFSKKDGLLKIVNIKEKVKTSNYKLSNGKSYRKGVLIQYFDLCDAYPNKKIDIQEFYKINAMINTAKTRSSRKKVPFNISILYLYEMYKFSLPKSCCILGLKLNYYNSVVGGANLSPSLDRIIPRLGYTKDNVRIISHRANSCLGNLSSREALAVLKDKLGKGKRIEIKDI